MNVRKEYLSILYDITFREKRSTDNFVIRSVSDFTDRWSDPICIPTVDVSQSEILPRVIYLSVHRTFKNPITW